MFELRLSMLGDSRDDDGSDKTAIEEVFFIDVFDDAKQKFNLVTRVEKAHWREL
jgi:hypothetical protein